MSSILPFILYIVLENGTIYCRQYGKDESLLGKIYLDTIP